MNSSADFQNDIAATSPFAPTTDELLQMVIAMCRDNIFQRVRKLANSFGVSNNKRQEESNLWDFDETKEPHQELEAMLKHAWLRDTSTVQFLDKFTRLVGNVTKTSEIKDFRKIFYFSSAVSSFTNLKMVLNEKQVRCFKKLGDYMQVLQRMPSILKKASGARITIEQVLTSYTPYPF